MGQDWGWQEGAGERGWEGGPAGRGLGWEGTALKSGKLLSKNSL